MPPPGNTQTTGQILSSALAQVAPEHRHSMVIGEALRNAGSLDIPGDDAEFRSFVAGPLRQAALKVLGEDAAARLTEALLTDLPSAAPKRPVSPPPRPSRGPQSATMPGRSSTRDSRPDWTGETLDYGEGPKLGYGRRPDVVLAEPDEVIRAALVAELEAKRYLVLVTSNAMEALNLCQQNTPRVLVANVALGDATGFELASFLKARLGDDAPQIILLHDASSPPERNEDVACVLHRRAYGPMLQQVAAFLSGNGASGAGPT